MTYFVINPGSGPVEDSSEAEATANIKAFVEDLGLDEVVIESTGKEDRGRWTFILRHGERQSEINMPGIALKDVRFISPQEQNIWHFPRLYENGSSWVWCYALSQSHAHLTGEDEVEGL